MKNFNNLPWNPRSVDTELKIRTIEMHTGGEPLRVIISGYPEIRGKTILEKRRYCFEKLDHLRKLLMWEPRGHADMYGCLVVPPDDNSADFGVIFMHNEGYSTMCGHATIAIARLAVDQGWVEKSHSKTQVRIDAPCGRINAWVSEDGNVSFEGVPSFLLAANITVQLRNTQTIRCDIAYGGAFYAYVDITQLELELNSASYSRIIQLGREIKSEVIRQVGRTEHPFETDLSFLYGTIFYEAIGEGSLSSRNVCVFADGELDRSPTGSGVCGRLALHYTKGELGRDESLLVESITGSLFKGNIKNTLTYGPHEAVIPIVEGKAHVIGSSEFYLDPEDLFPEGFFLR